MKERPNIAKFCRFPAYVRTHSTGILRGLPLSTRTLEQSLVCYALPEVYRLPVCTYEAIAINALYKWRSSSHKATLIPQNKRQDTITTMIPCLCSFTVPSSAFSEPLVNKKRTQTLSHRELGSSTNCMVGGTGLEQHGHAAGGAAERSCASK